MARAVGSMLANPVWAEQLALEGRRAVEQFYSLDAMVDATERVYAAAYDESMGASPALAGPLPLEWNPVEPGSTISPLG